VDRVQGSLAAHAAARRRGEVATPPPEGGEDGLGACDDDDCAPDPACATSGDDCDAGVRTACSAYQGIDLIGPCVDDGDSVVPGTVPVPEFSQRCVDTYECSMNAGSCVTDPLGPAECACGAIDLVVCREQGPAADAPCADEWLSATDCPDGDWGCMLDTFSDVSLPSGYANYTIECMNAECQTECFPEL